jgi:hypothetical protein
MVPQRTVGEDYEYSQEGQCCLIDLDYTHAGCCAFQVAKAALKKSNCNWEEEVFWDPREWTLFVELAKAAVRLSSCLQLGASSLCHLHISLHQMLLSPHQVALDFEATPLHFQYHLVAYDGMCGLGYVSIRQ